MNDSHSLYGGKGWYVAILCVVVWLSAAALALKLYGGVPDLYGMDTRVDKPKIQLGEKTKEKSVLKAVTI